MMYTWRQLQAIRPRGAQTRHERTAVGRPIELYEQRYGFLPLRFRYDGDIHVVQRITRTWERTLRGGRRSYRYFTVQCTNNRTITIAQDLQSGAWQAVEPKVAG